MSAIPNTKPVTGQPRGKKYKNKAGQEFETGTRVRLTKKALSLFRTTDDKAYAGKGITVTAVGYVFPDIKGLVRLEDKVGGYWTWDVNDLEVVT